MRQGYKAGARDEILERLLSPRIKLATVSGVLTTTPAQIKRADMELSALELITTKSYQLSPNSGNREPILAEASVGSYVNAVGLRNPGAGQGYAGLMALRESHSMRCLLNVSISANSIDDFVELARIFSPVADILELNFSCPHARAGYGAAIGSDASLVANYVRAIRASTSALIFPKLTTNAKDIGEVALAAVRAGADGISAINSIGPTILLEPHTLTPVLSNVFGGMSGAWIKETALKKVAEIRERVGRRIPIIGMGGIATGGDVSDMIEAGANVVGIGSAFIRVTPANRGKYLEALRHDAVHGTNMAEQYLSNEPLMQYKPYRVAGIVQPNNSLRLIMLDGEAEFKACQYFFLWVAGVGERPYSAACSNPLSFLVRKREYDNNAGKGLVSHALFELREGDEIMLRGPYGCPPPTPPEPNVFIVVGGTAGALLPGMCNYFKHFGYNVSALWGVSSPEEALLVDRIKGLAEVKVVPDLQHGKCSLFEALPNLIGQSLGKNSSFYNAGPGQFPEIVAGIEEKMGAKAEAIFLSMEMHTSCGLGVCGSCDSIGRLTCSEGSFVSLSELRSY